MQCRSDVVSDKLLTTESDTYDLCGCPINWTSMTATKPSDAFTPFTATVTLWLMPMLVFGSKPVTYVMLLWYVYPAQEVVPVTVVPLVRLREGMENPVIFPINQSLG